MRLLRIMMLGAIALLPSVASAQTPRVLQMNEPASTSEVLYIQQQGAKPVAAAPVQTRVVSQSDCCNPCSTPCRTTCTPTCAPSCPCPTTYSTCAAPCATGCNTCAPTCCEPAPCVKHCVPETTIKKVQKVHYSSKCEEYCLPNCGKLFSFGKSDCCEPCKDNCGKVRTRNVLVKKIRICEECETKCVVPKCETVAPAAPVKK